jgi:lipid-A-disaccharide synthase-like uncharacterized protein
MPRAGRNVNDPVAAEAPRQAGLVESRDSLDRQPDMDFLHQHFQHIIDALRTFELTPWKLVGYLGMGLFTSRWFVQMYFTRKHKRVVVPMAFWWLSVSGSILLLTYFIFGKNDSVGILSNLFPAFVSVYNLIMHRHDLRARRLAQSGS